MEKISGNNDTFPLPIPGDKTISEEGYFTDVYESLVDDKYVVKKIQRLATRLPSRKDF